MSKSKQSEFNREAAEAEAATCCPVCKTGRLQIVDTIARLPRRCDPPLASGLVNIPYQDSS